MTNEEAVKNINVYIMSEFENIPKQVLDALVLAVKALDDKKTSKHLESNKTDLYEVEELNLSRGSSVYHVVVQAESVEEAERLGKEYLKNDSRVLWPKFLKVTGSKCHCPEIITKDNIEQLIKSNFYKK